MGTKKVRPLLLSIAVTFEYTENGNKNILAIAANPNGARQPIATNIPVSELAIKEKERLSKIDGFDTTWDRHVEEDNHSPDSTCIMGEYRPSII